MALKKPRTAWLAWTAGVVIGFVALSWIVHPFLPASPHSQEAQDKALARKTIEACWREQQRKSLSPETQRFIAGACEQGEADFYRRNGHKP